MADQATQIQDLREQVHTLRRATMRLTGIVVLLIHSYDAESVAQVSGDMVEIKSRRAERQEIRTRVLGPTLALLGTMPDPISTADIAADLKAMSVRSDYSREDETEVGAVSF